ncbi:phosphonate metabolism protein/1,5-bisphosphokinase (PRPP-forming) PhnN [Rhodospira trueperi]|uniref:Ribose 1,5-bisphosphate phosphokinase PhnN n=1 Tax=Rhodospira trueperi TaxID=69960 RepID=A0A1G6Z0W2_9PROT|nr:phosphonate metabolism protein/1,5-bisphosphokinase (PRPP-forming) PhnN [Rhodospira trueperi]SDD96250.1 ribose 1,5-bisphosphokinase [Rhodospira trueperi]
MTVIAPAPVGHGGLVYIIGASGAGKDTLIDWARERLAALRPDLPVAFAHRYITRRGSSVGEAHVPLTLDAFETRRAAGLFAMAWASVGTLYGIGVEIDLWRAAGLTVVVNGSREHLAAASQRYPDIRPVLITAPAEVLRQRLQARGRETPDEIEARLRRTEMLPVEHPRLARVDNSASVEIAGSRLMALIQAIAEAPHRATAAHPA